MPRQVGGEGLENYFRVSCILEILPQKDFSIQAVPDDDKSITFLVNIYNITTASIAEKPEGFPVVLAVQQFAVT